MAPPALTIVAPTLTISDDPFRQHKLNTEEMNLIFLLIRHVLILDILIQLGTRSESLIF
jgi:hypothetical protein